MSYPGWIFGHTLENDLTELSELYDKYQTEEITEGYEHSLLINQQVNSQAISTGITEGEDVHNLTVIPTAWHDYPSCGSYVYPASNYPASNTPLMTGVGGFGPMVAPSIIPHQPGVDSPQEEGLTPWEIDAQDQVLCGECGEIFEVGLGVHYCGEYAPEEI